MRALSQSLAKEFGKDNIHVGLRALRSSMQLYSPQVAHAIMDGGILTGRAKEYMPAERIADPAATLQPDSIAKARTYPTSRTELSLRWEFPGVYVSNRSGPVRYDVGVGPSPSS